MHPRILEKKLDEAVRKYPVVTVVGPRQSGKSTLIKKQFPEKSYVNLEHSRHAEFAQKDPIAFLNQFPDGAILDEVQKAPQLLSDIQVIVDEQKRNGMFILSGSENLLLSQSISQSLAGRTLVLKLLPLTIKETYPFSLKLETLNDFLFHGFYPRIYDQELDPNEMYGSYAQTYLERDVRNLLEVKNLSLFRKFIELCAGRVGQLLNKASLANDLGISQSTVEQWISILEATYVCYRLQPWYSNIGKRLIKSPKLYFYDVGLAAYLIGINNQTQLQTHPLRGSLFENMQTNEAIKYFYNRNKQNKLYFYRDSQGLEVDLLIQNGSNYIPVEIKAAETFHQDMLKNIVKLKKFLGESLERSVIVMGHKNFQARTEFDIVGWDHLEAYLSDERGL